MKDNNGLTLVELIISIAISSLVALSLLFIVSYGLKNYSKANEEALLQAEFQTVTNQLEKLIIEAYNVKFDVTNKKLKIYQENAIYEVYLVGDELNFRQFNLVGDLVGSGFFGRYISEFEVKDDTKPDNKNNKIKISISFKKGSSNEITLDKKTIVLRNSIKATP